MKIVNIEEKAFISSERPEEFQQSFQQKCGP